MTAPSHPAAPRVLELHGSTFARLRALLLERAGISLGDAKRPLVVGRLSRRVRELGLSSFDAYYERVIGDASGAELVRLLDMIATNETSFFREPAQFEFLQHRLVPSWREDAEAGLRGRHVRVWSAGCSTGQEPVSLAMALLDALPADDGWRVEIVATDLSTRALAQAASATWPIERARQIPPHLLKRFMLRGTGPQTGSMRAGPEVRAAITYERLNLVEDPYPAGAPFDLVLCRNVLIYFTPEGRRAVVERLLRHLAPGGHFLLGHAESLDLRTHRARSVAPNVYRRETR
ncbi:MAG: protein-glutamate O-methyltransferase CheR [Gemmatimonadaceae bacterium]|nr:protein-glutamate O-methyltransferase CheR [Gemmatimonadaceae bacterium]NUQ92401.1 protein-glutamate O-methyltransferase CheR [Gemmatimonadaceae bacterium]NUR18291.1 protein-glutamate O-methyltransferase CheR [Gemmatimonadaceae bacterium]NUS98881.1 protein-glutamate O-methyltransferase CheR [Gemmatimonadaceae bacterium]